jgi:membrane fusion protein (multidrug efflux system)
MSTTAPQKLAEVKAPEAGTAEPPPRRGRSRKALLGGGAVAVLLAGVGGYQWLTRGEETTDNAQVEGGVVPLAVRVAGPVLRLHVKDNARVHAGDLLAELDPREYAVRVKQAEAELESARAQAQAADAQEAVTEAGARGGLTSARAVVSSSTAAVSSAEAQVSVARAALSRAETQARKATLDLERVRQLRTENVVPQQALDDAQAASETAQASVEGARAQLAAAEEARSIAQSKRAEAQGQLDQSTPIDAKMAAARANAALAHARVKSAEAALEQARLLLDYTRILAPADGQVSSFSLHEGQLVSPGQLVAELVPAQTYVVANFKETQLGAMRPGQRVEVKVDAFSGRTFEGQVESLSGATGARFSLLPPDNASGNFVKVVQRVPVRIAWTQPVDGLGLRPGLSAEVTVYTRQ